MNGKRMQTNSRIESTQTSKTNEPVYTIAVYEGPAPVNASLLLTCSHPRVVLEAAESIIEQAAMEAVGKAGSQPVLNLLDGIRSTQANYLAQLRKSGVVA